MQTDLNNSWCDVDVMAIWITLMRSPQHQERSRHPVSALRLMIGKGKNDFLKRDFVFQESQFF
jgi:hypothetical protein